MHIWNGFKTYFHKRTKFSQTRTTTSYAVNSVNHSSISCSLPFSNSSNWAPFGCVFGNIPFNVPGVNAHAHLQLKNWLESHSNDSSTSSMQFDWGANSIIHNYLITFELTTFVFFFILFRSDCLSCLWLHPERQITWPLSVHWINAPSKYAETLFSLVISKWVLVP